MSTPIENFWKLRLEKTKAALEKHFFECSIHQDLSQAVDHIVSGIIPDNKLKSVGFGGSATMAASGVVDQLKALPGFTVVDRNDPGLSPEERTELGRQTFLQDLFIASSNAVTADGELVNLDKFGNRVAALTFGPKKVALLVGRNKLCDNLDDAQTRVKFIAAPTNAMRLNLETPCAKTAQCNDCNTPQRICGVWTVTERCFPQGRIHVLLINQELGF